MICQQKSNYIVEKVVFYFLFLLSMGGCMSNKKLIEQARSDIDGVNCLIKLEEKLKENHCSRLEVNRRRHEVMIRCLKVDRERKNFWDTWWFRISSSMLQIHPDQIQQVKEHTICIDPQFRIEAYPPEKK